MSSDVFNFMSFNSSLQHNVLSSYNDRINSSDYDQLFPGNIM